MTRRLRSGSGPLAVTAMLVALGGCQADAPRDKPAPQDGVTPDEALAAAAPAIEAPRLIGTPTATPLSTVAIRGTTTGSSLVIKGGATGPLVRLPLPSGDFCVDVPLGDGPSSTIEVTGLAEGEVSPPALVTVARDLSAPQPADPYCTTPPCGGEACPTEETDCNDGEDNDLDGWADVCDLDCSGCVDDAYEPNDYPASVPSLAQGTHVGMRICPCHDDWFAFHLEQGERLRVSALRDEGRVSLRLFRAEDAEDGGYKSKTPVKYGLVSGDTVKIDWEADKAGWYFLYAYSLTAEQAASYRLIVY